MAGGTERACAADNLRWDELLRASEVVGDLDRYLADARGCPPCIGFLVCKPNFGSAPILQNERGSGDNTQFPAKRAGPASGPANLSGVGGGGG